MFFFCCFFFFFLCVFFLCFFCFVLFFFGGWVIERSFFLRIPHPTTTRARVCQLNCFSLRRLAGEKFRAWME